MAEITTNQLRAKWTGKDRWLSDGGRAGPDDWSQV